MRDKLEQTFDNIFGHAAEIVVRAPGRVNLIGEHTDYNQGWVLPMAIDAELLIAASPRTDHEVNLVALDRDNAHTSFFLADMKPNLTESWSNYVIGVAALLKQSNFSFPGFNAVISSNIPMGAGLSSSAALLVATGILIEQLGHFSLDKVILAKLCQQAEHSFCGVQSGIMDHFVITLAQTGKALLIDCKDLSCQQIPLPSSSKILICNTMKSRQLSFSEYNKRRSECADALALLEKIYDKRILSLRDISLAELTTVEKKLPRYLFERAKHVVSENSRVLKAVMAAQIEDLPMLGHLMNESHESLQHLYQVSSPELDLMVKIARNQPGVFGARLTGAGFGGCTVNLVEETAVESVKKAISEEYLRQTHIAPEIYVATPQAGASVI
jgi:galactokinase